MDKNDNDGKTGQGTFETIPGIQGKIFIPCHQTAHLKKHPCKDCFACQNCGDERCHLCRKKSGAKEKEAEQSG